MNKKITSTIVALALLAGTTPAWAEETPNPSSAATVNTQVETSVKADTAANTETSQQTSGSNANVTTDSDSTATVETVNPDSFLYKLQDLIYQLKLLFTFDDKAKADLLIEQADTKIKELQTLNQNNQTEYNEKLIETINETLEKAQQILKEAKVEAENQQDHTAKIEIEEKEATAMQTEKHSLVVLKSLLDKVPEQGKKGIENAIAKQESKLNIRMKSTQPAHETTQNAQITTQEKTESSVGASQAANQTPANGSTEQSAAASASQQTAAEVNVQLPVFEGNVKVKQDNGLHLVQVKPQDKQEKHQEKQQDKH